MKKRYEKRVHITTEDCLKESRFNVFDIQYLWREI